MSRQTLTLKKKKISDQQVVKKYQTIQHSANSRGIEFDLPFQSLKNIMNAKKCHYTKIQISVGAENPLNQLSIERKDPTKGYIKGNVVAVSSQVNVFKGSLERAHKFLSKSQQKRLYKLALESLQ